MSRIVEEVVMPNNTGRTFVVKKGNRIRIEGTTICDFVAFNLDNLKERFDQARTKVDQEQKTIYVTKGNTLYSKSNNPMLLIEEDEFVEGHHDLEYGMCSRSKYELIIRKGLAEKFYGRRPEELPQHGCWENLEGALRPWGVAREDIPSPLNLFQHVELDSKTGHIKQTKIRPRKNAAVTMRALMDCLAAASACPDMSAGGKPIKVSILDDAQEKQNREDMGV